MRGTAADWERYARWNTAVAQVVYGNEVVPGAVELDGWSSALAEPCGTLRLSTHTASKRRTTRHEQVSHEHPRRR